DWSEGQGAKLLARSPIDGSTLAEFAGASAAQADAAIEAAAGAFVKWRTVPAPVRGQFVRAFGEQLRSHKAELATIVSWEAGKITQEALGEVQEMIDICEFAVGLSRQLYGKTIASERPGHRLTEQYHPLGPIGVISAFNFPVAVWAWNAAIAWVCGDPVVWKPSEKTPLTALATHAILGRALARFGDAPAGLAQLVLGGADVGAALVDDARVALVSATGSTAMGRNVAPRLAARFARALLELGGNNAAIVCPSADLELAVRAIAFAAMGTAGQRCTTLRRLFVHDDVYADLLPRLRQAYASVRVGDPRAADTLVGPLVDAAAADGMASALAEARALGGTVHGGDTVPVGAGGTYVRPALVELPAQSGPMLRETFAPILYVVRYRELADAIALQNAATQGLSSSIFTRDLGEAERFLSASGSDCGIANVNLGPSGAEIGGAFGGEKETGGGRESGSDSWRAYMRRATNTINYGRTLPLAQGVRFDLG
ncbi:MAG TPA: aldehyde dehydrogenase family protein, partial [Kofleriaceae bacterium]|nr:aldehyde dehydrogenase family protein [Kofleriaceae bacterium]